MSHSMEYNKRLQRRHRADRRFKYYGMAAIAFALAFLAFFFVDIIGKALPAYQQAYIQVPISYNADVKDNYNKAITRNYRYLVSRSYLRTLPKKLLEHPELLGTTEHTWVLASYRVDQYVKGHATPYSSPMVIQRWLKLRVC